MPCKTVTIPSPNASFTSPTIQSVNTSPGTATMTYQISNEGAGEGTARVEVTIDVGNNGSTDAVKTFQHTLSPGSGTTNTVTFNADVSVDTDANICATLQ